MKIIGIVGSPRKERGLTDQIVKKTLEGAAAAGAETEVTYLRDENLDYCIHCDYDCFTHLECKQENLKPLFEKIETADGIVLGAPVYIWQANGLTTSFFDKFRLSSGPWDREEKNHRSALGIAVAGGTGTGVFPALKSIYSFLNLWEFNPLSPLPVTRFNLETALEKAEANGKKMGSDSVEKIDDTAELMATYEDLKYLNYSRKDEFKWLANQMIKDLKNDSDNKEQVNHIRKMMAAGENLLETGKKGKAIKKYMTAYKEAREIWEK